MVPVRAWVGPQLVMDLLEDVGDSDSSCSSSDLQQAASPDRSLLYVGSLSALPDFSARCLGDDVSHKGSKVTRLVCVQCGSSGRDRFQWGLWYGQCLATLGADIGVLSETALASESQHDLACRGMRAAGFHAISHGAQGAAGPAPGSGVLLAVRAGYAGVWSEVSRDNLGRALAATLCSSGGVLLRVVGIYGPVGGCLPRTSLNPCFLAAESSVKQFIDDQVSHATLRHQALLIGGDLNSFCSLDLDCWGGSYSICSESIAAHLASAGLLDAFRVRHPSLRAYTFFAHSGAASRLDAVWLLPSPDAQVSVLNASVLWLWDRRVDHEPVVVDLDVALPLIPYKPSTPPPWRHLVRRLDRDLPSLFRECSERCESFLQGIDAELDGVLQEWTNLDTPDCEGLDGLLGWPNPEVPKVLYDRLISAHDRLAKFLVDSLPPSPPGGNHQEGRVSAAWHACLLELRRVRRAVLDALPSCQGHLDCSRFPLHQAQTLWDKACSMERHLRSGSKSQPPPLAEWDLFSTSPVDWADGVGLSREVAGTVLLQKPSRSDTASPCTEVSWSSLPHPPEASLCISALHSWVNEAAKRQAGGAAKQFSSARGQRIQLLRCGEVKAWAKRMRPPLPPLSEYTPAWVTNDQGCRRRPSSASDVLLGASQEWKQLLQEPPLQWNHPAVFNFSSAAVPRRGSLNFQVISNSHKHGTLGRVGRSMLEPGPWRLQNLSEVKVSVCSDSVVAVGPWLVRFVDGRWLASRLPPCTGPTYRLLALGCIPARLLGMDHFCWPDKACLVLRLNA